LVKHAREDSDPPVGPDRIFMIVVDSLK